MPSPPYSLLSAYKELKLKSVKKAKSLRSGLLSAYKELKQEFQAEKQYLREAWSLLSAYKELKPKEDFPRIVEAGLFIKCL